MLLVSSMQPRDARDAGRTLGLLVGVALFTTVISLPVSGPGTQGDTQVTLLVLAGLAFVAMTVLAIMARLLGESHRLAWTVSPILAVLAVTLIGLGTSDTSIGAQIFFVFCALYGGALLDRPGAMVMACAAVLGEAFLVFPQLPIQDAISDFLYVSATVITTAYLLARNAARLAGVFAELNQRAGTDSLTGLVNRRTFDLAIEKAIKESRERTGDPLGTSMILVDIDWFKAINDEFGHPGGDEILVQMSELIVSMARRDDVVCRLGGDELAVLMPACAAEAGARRGDQIIEAVRAHEFTVGPATRIHVSVSAGVAHAPGHAASAEDLYAVADSALYAAKRAGRDRVVQQAS